MTPYNLLFTQLTILLFFIASRWAYWVSGVQLGASGGVVRVHECEGLTSKKLFCTETIFGRSWVTIVHRNFKKRLKTSKNCVQKWKNARRSHSIIHRRLKICQKNIWVQNPALGQIWPESINATHFMGQRSKNLFCWLWGPMMLFPKFSKWQMKIWLKAKILTY